MGRERGIIRWDVQRQMLLEELHRLQQTLRASEGKAPPDEAVVERVAQIQARLRAMGPSPQAKMG